MNEGIISTLFESPNNKFGEHLTLQGNDRIVFSGKFGMGKTTFLQYFFEEGTQKKNFGSKSYKLIPIFPVNYSIAANEDIFKYIKYDILSELLNGEYLIGEKTKSYLQTLPKFFGKNLHKVAAAFVSMIPVIGKDMSEAFEKFDKLKEEYFKEHDEVSKSDEKILEDYRKEITQKEGLYEDGIISKLVQNIILDNKAKDQETVLIIDDLDRVDPEHIFRILNVFAAHFDSKKFHADERELKNKFGFDKIIIVCDIYNIRQIFKARFGIKTDFNGYIDKFYSYGVFDFNNKKEILKQLKQKLSHADFYFNGRVIGQLDEINMDAYFGEQSHYHTLIRMLVINNQIDLRNILKWLKLPIKYYSEISINGNVWGTPKFPIIFILFLLSQIKGDFESLKDAFQMCDNDSSLTSQEINCMHAMIYILSGVKHNYKTQESSQRLPFNIKNVMVEIYIDKDAENGGVKIYSKPYDNNFKGDLAWSKGHLIWTLSKMIDFIVSDVEFQ